MIVSLIITLLVLGIIAFLVQKAPFIDPTFKSFIVYVLIVVAALVLLIVALPKLLTGSNLIYGVR